MYNVDFFKKICSLKLEDAARACAAAVSCKCSNLKRRHLLLRIFFSAANYTKNKLKPALSAWRHMGPGAHTAIEDRCCFHMTSPTPLRWWLSVQSQSHFIFVPILCSFHMNSFSVSNWSCLSSVLSILGNFLKELFLVQNTKKTMNV